MLAASVRRSLVNWSALELSLVDRLSRRFLIIYRLEGNNKFTVSSQWLVHRLALNPSGWQEKVCSHWLAGYKYALIGWQDTSMLSLAERTFVSWISFADCKHSKLLLAGRFSRKLLLASRTVGSRFKG